MDEFDRLGTFYLGRSVEPGSQAPGDPLVLYDSADLTTHAVIIGMTGSGKTGLGIGLLEEAALDHIPVIAIDPKGDLGNIMLTFPALDGAAFRPWINPHSAASAGQDLDSFAAAQATLWKNGLRDWGQSAARIQRLRDSVEAAIFTPGSSAGIPVSVLRSFRRPPPPLRDDPELLHEQIAATATGVLTLLDIDSDPLTSREHILVSNILKQVWAEDRDIDLPGLIQAIQTPPLEQVGVMALDDFYPARDRAGLAMALNNLLAAPGFDAWMRGVPLDAQSLFHTDQGKPRLSVMSIAHLGDAERMFFVTMLLNEIISWMRRQPGTGSLRAILYMDEIFGYLPPTAKPASKALFLTLLKQARAYGLGLVLATQNPVDLDYKALSNAGTWFIGRLQTERDKARVMEGLEGAATGRAFDRQGMDRLLAGLGKRRFLLHNVHETRPVVFATRWVMSYLAGPFTREQIRRLMADRQPPPRQAGNAPPDSTPEQPDSTAGQPGGRPALPAAIRQAYWPALASADAPQHLVYQPWLLGNARVVYHNARYQVDARRTIAARLSLAPATTGIDWTRAELLAPADALPEAGPVAAAHAPLATAAAQAASYDKWRQRFENWLRDEQALVLFRSTALKLVSTPDETQGEFRARLQLVTRERRDAASARLRSKYDKKIAAVEKRVFKAQQQLDQQQSQAVQSRIDTALSIGSALLGAFMGRKRSSIDGAGSAVRKAAKMRKESSEATLAQSALRQAEQELAELRGTFDTELARIAGSPDAQAQELKEIRIRPRPADIDLVYFGLAWQPRPQAGAAQETQH